MSRFFSWSRLLIVLIWLCLVFGIIIRFYHLSLPNAQVFDEVYFPVFAAKMLQGVLVYDVHPPLGKMLISLGIWMFGDHPFGWRIIPALFGTGLLALFYGLCYSYMKNRTTALLLAALAALDGLLVTYSRLGYMDGILLFFILATFWAMVGLKNRKRLWLVAVLLGLAISVKWLALAALAPVAFVAWRRGWLRELIFWLPLSAIVYLGVVCAGELIGHSAQPWQDLLQWHRQTWQYQTTLSATHPYSSLWWSWPFLERPVLMYYQVLASGKIQMITDLGNPLIWWGSTIAVVLSVEEVIMTWVYERAKFWEHPLLPLLVGYFAFWLPWAIIHRVLFLYHYLPSYAFALLMLVYWLSRLRPYWQTLFLLGALAMAIYFLPIWLGLDLSQAQITAHVWFKSWL